MSLICLTGASQGKYRKCRPREDGIDLALAVSGQDSDLNVCVCVCVCV